MAIYRQVHTTIWQDGWISTLPPNEKLLWFYILTNAKTTQSGVYEFLPRYACFETGLSQEEVNEALRNFTKTGRVHYSEDTNEIMIVNWLKYNSARSPKVAKVIDKEIESIKSDEFKQKVIMIAQHYEYPIRAKMSSENTAPIPYPYSTDTISQPEPEPEPEHNQNHHQNQKQNAPVDVADDPYQIYQECFGMLNSINSQNIAMWVKDFGSNDLVIEAMERAAKNNKQYTYAEGIMKNWDKKNIKTMAQVEAQDNEFSRQHAPKSKTNQQNTLPDWAKDNYQHESKPMSDDDRAKVAQQLADLKQAQEE